MGLPDRDDPSDGIMTATLSGPPRASSPRDSLSDPGAFVDAGRLFETGGGDPGATRVFTTGPGFKAGSARGWRSAPEALPGDDEPAFTLRDIFYGERETDPAAWAGRDINTIGPDGGPED